MSHEHTPHPIASSPKPAAYALLALLALYAVLCLAKLPQQWTAAAVAHAGGDHAAEKEAAPDAAAGHAEAAAAPAAPPLWTVAPFVLLLGAIAIFPLTPAVEHWWESNLHRFYVAAGLGVITLAYYGLLHRGGVDLHWPAHSVVQSHGAVQWNLVGAVLANAMLQEFIPFIVLLFSLYTIAGGIRIEGDLRADPLTNAAIIAVGGVLASLIGTTGAAMLLVRLLLETNRERKHVAHTVVFFIFVVCNCGGCLLPIGDPPLFLGYLQGVEFLWTLRLWPSWLMVNGLLLLAYVLLDQFVFYRQETIRDIERDIEQTRRLRISGAWVNGPLLIAVVLAVALLDPTKPVPGTHWHPWMYLREAVQLGLVAASLLIGSAHVRSRNQFNFGAIIEVAALFTGIFICMQPALQILHANGAYLVEHFRMGPAKFFWASGALSSFLDNAPTYLVFFQTALDPALAGSATGGVPEDILRGISLGSVFMGAMTYIGNGPNFMVKAIAEKSNVRMPSFFGYMVYSCLILLPILALMVWRHLT
jgi:Na+/H+ antiporter NhaD/arsenite permease-like protein